MFCCSWPVPPGRSAGGNSAGRANAILYHREEANILGAVIKLVGPHKGGLYILQTVIPAVILQDHHLDLLRSALNVLSPVMSRGELYFWVRWNSGG